MEDFPYLEIVQKAYRHSLDNIWLWVLGLFSGGLFTNFGGWNFSGQPEKVFSFLETSDFFSSPVALTAMILAFAGILAGFLILYGASLSGVIVACGKFEDPQDPNHQHVARSILRQGKKHSAKVIGLNLMVLAFFLVSLTIFALPISYLVGLKAYARAWVLGGLGLLIFVPAMVVFSFLRIYGPIFIVRYQASVVRSLSLSFHLLRHKLKESLMIGLFLLGLSIMFIFLVSFSIILMSTLFSLSDVYLTSFPRNGVRDILFAATLACWSLVVIIFSAGFSVFKTITWVAAVEEMVKTRRLEEPGEKALAIESEAV